jgi:hypothetical protein
VGAIPWLLTGGTLLLHQPFAPTVFLEQCARAGCDTVVVPGALASRFAQAGLPAIPSVRNVFGLWRSPERLSIGAAWQHPHVRMIDVLAFGETAVICGRRGASGEPADVPLGLAFTSREEANVMTAAETTVTQAGTLAIRGAMVPRHPFPPGAERAPMACFKPDALGFADTRYACRADRDRGTIQLTGPPPGIVSVGGYRFVPDQLQDLVSRTASSAVLAALPDALSGHRLAGQAEDHASVRQTLDALGVNPLVSGAFNDRRKADAA